MVILKIIYKSALCHTIFANSSTTQVNSRVKLFRACCISRLPWCLWLINQKMPVLHHWCSEHAVTTVHASYYAPAKWILRSWRLCRVTSLLSFIHFLPKFACWHESVGHKGTAILCVVLLIWRHQNHHTHQEVNKFILSQTMGFCMQHFQCWVNSALPHPLH